MYVLILAEISCLWLDHSDPEASVWALFGSRLCELCFIKLCSCLLQKTMCAMRVEYSQTISPKKVAEELTNSYR